MPMKKLMVSNPTPKKEWKVISLFQAIMSSSSTLSRETSICQSITFRTNLVTLSPQLAPLRWERKLQTSVIRGQARATTTARPGSPYIYKSLRLTHRYRRMLSGYSVVNQKGSIERSCSAIDMTRAVKSRRGLTTTRTINTWKTQEWQCWIVSGIAI